jgi:hypothetical protein
MIEVAEVFRRFAADYFNAHGASMPPSHRRAIEDILACRTAALGGQVWRCEACDAETFSYHSCVMGEIRNGESAVATWPVWHASRSLPSSLLPIRLVRF